MAEWEYVFIEISVTLRRIPSLNIHIWILSDRSEHPNLVHVTKQAAEFISFNLKPFIWNNDRNYENYFLFIYLRSPVFSSNTFGMI